MQANTKGILKKAGLSCKDEPLKVAQEIKIWRYWQMPYAQTIFILENEMQKILCDIDLKKSKVKNFSWRRFDCELIYHDQKIRQALCVTYGITAQMFRPY